MLGKFRGPDDTLSVPVLQDRVRLPHGLRMSPLFSRRATETKRIYLTQLFT